MLTDTSDDILWCVDTILRTFENMLLRKKVVTFARLGGKLSAAGFPPSIIDQVLKKIVSQKYPPIPGCSLFFDEKITNVNGLVF